MGIFVKTEALHDRWKAFHAATVVESEIVDYGEIFKEWIFLRDISDVLFELCRIFRGNLSAVFDETGVWLISGNWKSVICWLQYDNGVAEKSPEEFGIKRIGE